MYLGSRRSLLIFKRSSLLANTAFLLSGLLWSSTTASHLSLPLQYYLTDFLKNEILCNEILPDSILALARARTIIFFYIYLAVPGLSSGMQDLFIYFFLACRIFSCGMWYLVPWPGIEPRAPALGVQSLSHSKSQFLIREVPRTMILNFSFSKYQNLYFFIIIH